MAAPPAARLLWDAGPLWSLMAWEAASQAGLPLWPISAKEIADGGLTGAGLLMVPGGWPALKRRALGKDGRQAIRDFVESGGCYFGLCGGAGLALNEGDGLGLVNLGRSHGQRRLPAISGLLQVEPTPEGREHPLLATAQDKPHFHVWWPGQFAAPDPASGIKVLARYQGPSPELFSADIRVQAVAAGGWPQLEADYGLSLDPGALWGQPAVLAAQRGKGKLVLSYLHFDTPGHQDGQNALAGLWSGWLGISPGPQAPALPRHSQGVLGGPADDLWQRGESLGLWRPRHEQMPLWRRASRGLEFWSLVRLCRATEALAGPQGPPAELISTLQPIWDQGGTVLRGLAAGLGGYEPGGAQAQALHSWFPAPRRQGGQLALALGMLEKTLLDLIRQARR